MFSLLYLPSLPSSSTCISGSIYTQILYIIFSILFFISASSSFSSTVIYKFLFPISLSSDSILLSCSLIAALNCLFCFNIVIADITWSNFLSAFHMLYVCIYSLEHLFNFFHVCFIPSMVFQSQNTLPGIC